MNMGYYKKIHRATISEPYIEKAEAVKKTLSSKVTNLIPATKLKEHKNFNLFIDKNSASLLDIELV